MKKEKIISGILIVIIILLVGAIGIFGYTMYNEIIGEGNIKINFGGESGFTIGGYDEPSGQKDVDTSFEEIIFLYLSYTYSSFSFTNSSAFLILMYFGLLMYKVSALKYIFKCLEVL